MTMIAIAAAAGSDPIAIMRRTATERIAEAENTAGNRRTMSSKAGRPAFTKDRGICVQPDGGSTGHDAARVASFAEADAAWWLESFDPLQTFEQIRQRVHQGPPRFL